MGCLGFLKHHHQQYLSRHNARITEKIPSLKTKIFAPKNDGNMLVSGRATSLIKKSPKSSLELQFEIHGSIFFQELLDFFSPVHMQGGPPAPRSYKWSYSPCLMQISSFRSYMDAQTLCGETCGIPCGPCSVASTKTKANFFGNKKTTFTWTFNSLGINPESR